MGFFGSLSLDIEVGGLNDLALSMRGGLGVISEMRAVLQKYTYKLQAQAVQNVSGINVTYAGGTFIINRQTGKLARSIQVDPSYGAGGLSSRVYASASYASAVENGSPERDLKAVLMGKVIPLPVKGNLKEKKAAVAAGTASAVSKFASTGRQTRTEYIAFRRITPNSKGWIIPAQPGRPFMAAAAEVIQPAFAHAVAETFAKYLNDR